MDPDSATNGSQNGSTPEAALPSLTFEEETRRAEDRIRKVLETLRAKDVPAGTDPAFLFRPRF